MQRINRWLSIVFFILFALWPQAVNAEPVSTTWHRHVRLHETLPLTQISIHPSSEGLVLQANAAVLQVPMISPTSIKVRSYKLSHRPDGYVAIVRLTSKTMRYTALLIAPNHTPRWLWFGRTDLFGDPGERTATIVKVNTHPTTSSILIAEQRERVRVCGQPLAMIHTQIVDPETLELRPISDSRIPSTMRSNASTLEAISQKPAWMAEMPNIELLQQNMALPYPRDFASWHWQSRHWPIEALRIELPASATSIRRVWLVGTSGYPVEVTFPSEAHTRVHWIVFSTPMNWPCVSVISEDADVDVSSFHVHGFSALDRNDGLERLIRAWHADNEAGDEAAALLKHWGPEAVGATMNVWPTLSIERRKNAIGIWEHYLPSEPLALKALVSAAKDPNARVRHAALDVLINTKDVAVEDLGPLSFEPSAQGDRVALWLATHHPEAAVNILLDAFGSSGGTERPVLRMAFERGVSTAPPARTLRTLEAWWASKPAISIRAAVILALANVQAYQSQANQWLRATLPDAQDFKDQWRLTQSTTLLPPDDVVDQWLATLLGKTTPWMLRNKALESIDKRNAKDHLRHLRHALQDSYPVVKQTAIHSLLKRKSKASWPVIERRLRDPAEWPLVKHAALSFLSELCVHEGSAAVVDILLKPVTPMTRSSQRLREHAWAVAMALGGKARKDALKIASSRHWPTLKRESLKRAAQTPPRCQIPGNL